LSSKTKGNLIIGLKQYHKCSKKYMPELATGTMLWPQHRSSIWRAMYLPSFL